MDDVRIDKDKNKNRSQEKRLQITTLRRASRCVAAVAYLAVLAACDGGGAAAPSVAEPLPDAQSAAAKLYTIKCGECHFRPQPAVHTASEWIGVVRRMDNHRTMKGKGALTEVETKQIVDYLAKYAKAD